MASFIQNSAVNSVGLEQQVFDFSDVGLPTQIPINPDVNGNNTYTRNSNYEWYGAALAQDGNIYAPPYGATQILGINTKTKKAFTIDVGAHTVAPNDQTYGSFVAHPNGKLYAIPMDAGRILEFDPINKTTSTFGLGSVPAGDWHKGIVASNGYIYCVPYNASSILKIDVYNRTVTSFGNTGYIGIGADSNQSNGDTGSAKFASGVIVGDKIYMPPMYARDSLATGNVSPNQQWIVGIIDTSNDTLDVTSFKFGESELPQIDDNAETDNNGGSYLTGNSMTYIFSSAIKGIDGKIYCLPHDYPYVCVIDPLTNTISRMNNNHLGTVTGTGSSTVFGRDDRPNSSGFDDDSECQGGVIAANGKIYAYIDGNNLNSPANNSMVEIDTENVSWKYIPLPVSMDGELWDNTFWYPITILGPDGGIYGIPYFQNYSTTGGDQGGNITYGNVPCVWHPPSASLPSPRILNNNQNGVF